MCCMYRYWLVVWSIVFGWWLGWVVTTRTWWFHGCTGSGFWSASLGVMGSCVAPLAPQWSFGTELCYMSLSTTVVACSVEVVFPCLSVVLVVVVIVGSVLIYVHTLVLVFSVICILASVWNVAIWVTGHRGFQYWALICYFCKPGIDLLVGLRYGVFKSDGVPVTLVILVTSHQCWCYEGVCVSILSRVDHE